MTLRTWLAILISGVWLHPVMAGIERISEGGVEINLSDLLPSGEPAVLVFHAPWDQASILLLEELVSWSEQHSNVTIYFINVVDARTQVYRQFSLNRLPSIIIVDRNKDHVGSVIDNITALEDILRDEGFL